MARGGSSAAGAADSGGAPSGAAAAPRPRARATILGAKTLLRDVPAWFRPGDDSGGARSWTRAVSACVASRAGGGFGRASRTRWQTHSGVQGTHLCPSSRHFPGFRGAEGPWRERCGGLRSLEERVFYSGDAALKETVASCASGDSNASRVEQPSRWGRTLVTRRCGTNARSELRDAATAPPPITLSPVISESPSNDSFSRTERDESHDGTSSPRRTQRGRPGPGDMS